MPTNASLFALISSRAPTDATTPLLITETASYTWEDMDATTARFAHTLTCGGIRPGDRVAVQVEKSPQSFFLYLACLRAGVVILPMNTAYLSDEIDYLIGNAKPTAVICDPTAAVTQNVANRHRVSRLWSMATDGSGSFVDDAASQSTDFPPTICAPDDTAAILYTSGTTGRPKGAMLSHRNLAANGEALRQFWHFTADDVLLHALPLFHAHGLFVACHTVLLAGSRILWLPTFDRARVIALLPRASVFMGVPTYYTRLLADPGFTAETCRNIRLFVSGSAPLLEDTFKTFRERTGHTILERYGMTETGMNTSNPHDGERRSGTVGLPLPGVSVRVAGEDGTILPAGSVGVLQVTGDNVFRGYVFSGYSHMPKKTAEDFTADGWFITGDLATISEDGYVQLVGRAKDLIITGGYNVYPKEVETVIDAIDGVAESAVIGLPDPDFGEAVTAVVQRQENRQDLTEAAILAATRPRLANYKQPKRIVFVDEMPRNAMGKVQKPLLRQLCQATTP